MITKNKNRRLVKIGHRYEYGVAWHLRNEGWQVEERGWMRFNDEGIDLIARKDGVERFIQCKGWGGRKKLHENVIDQLYGSVCYRVGVNQVSTVQLYVYTSCSATLQARAHAEKLGVTIISLPFPKNWKRKKQYL